MAKKDIKNQLEDYSKELTLCIWLKAVFSILPMQKKDKFTIAMTMIGATLNLCYFFKTNLLFVTVALLIFHSKKLHLMF